MRVTIVHASYSSSDPSGEDALVTEQFEAMERAGLTVNLIQPKLPLSQEMSRAELGRIGVQVASGWGANPSEEVARSAPDVVHIHNLFPIWGSNWLRGLRTPFVTTLHNFRAKCAKGTLYRDGRFCDLCVKKTTLESIKHSCYRGSRSQTIPLAVRSSVPFSYRPEYGAAAALIALSKRSSKIFKSMGLDSEKLVVIPNFCSVDSGLGKQFVGKSSRSGWIFAGRLSEEKGIRDLLKNWPSQERLTILGDGPLRKWVEAKQSSSIRYLGLRNRKTVLDLLGKSEGLIFASKMTENSPMTFIEALSVGTPTISLRGNAVADIIEASGCGNVISSLESLPNAMSALRKMPSVNRKCLTTFSRNFSEEIWVERTQLLYDTILHSQRS